MDAKKTGELISSQRKKLGYTQSQLGELIHVSDKAISRWETGRGFPDITIIEDLCKALHISSYELFDGELSKDEEKKNVFSDSFVYLKGELKKKKVLSFAEGLLLAAIILVTVFFHLNAPIYFEEPDEILKIETLSDESLVLRMSEKVEDYEISYIEEEGNRQAFVSCFRTKLSSLRKNRNEKLVSLGNKDGIDQVWYFPCQGSDRLIYASKEPDYGVETLNRLLYNGWIVLAVIGTAVFSILYLIFRKKYFAEAILKYGALPCLSLVLSILAVLYGRFDEVYNAVYYFTGIVLLFIPVYAGALLLINRRKSGI